MSAATTTVSATAEPAAAAVESTTAAKPTATAVVPTGPAAAVVSTGPAAHHGMSAGRVSSSAACEVVTPASIANSTAIANPAAIAYTTAISVPTAVSVPVPTASPIATIPRARADKESADEPARSVVPIGGARVGVVRVVAPRTGRSTIAVTIISVPVVAANPNPHTDLSVSRSRQ